MEQEFLAHIDQHQGIIRKVTRMYAQTEADREDLFQEILLQLWRSYSSYDPAQRFSTWMYRVALNTAITQLRKSKKRPLHRALEDEVEIPDSISESDPHPQLYEAISHLGKIDRAIVLLQLENHSYREIADIMQVSPSNVGVRLNRIKKKLKQFIKNERHESL